MKSAMLILCFIVGTLTFPVGVSSDGDMVDCCIKPCSCLGARAGKPQCVKKSREECKRLNGEVVADCMMCD